jgi:hypothetical protein
MSGNFWRTGDKMFLFNSSEKDCTNGVRVVILLEKALHIYNELYEIRFSLEIQ